MARTFAINLPINVQPGQFTDEVFDLLRKGARDAESVVDQLSKKLGEPIIVKTRWIQDVDTGIYTKEVNRTTATLEQYIKAQDKATRAQTGSLSSLRQQVNTQKQARDAIQKYQVALTATGQKIYLLRNEWAQADTKLKQLNQSLKEQSATFINFAGKQFKLPDFSGLLSIGNKITQIGAAIAVVSGAFLALNAAIQPVIQRAIQIDGLKLALTSFGVTSQQADGILQKAGQTALTYGGNLAQIERAYRRLTPAILASGGSLQETDLVIASLAAKTASLGLTTDQSNRYIEAFAQVMGKGKLQAEELNQQFAEIDPSLRAQLAAYVDTTYGITDLEDAMKKGVITADIFREFMIKAAEPLRSKLAGSATEAQQRILGLNESFNTQQMQNYVDTLNTLSLSGLSASFEGIGRAWKSLEAQFAQLWNTITTRTPYLGGVFRVVAEILNGVVVNAIGAVVAALTLLYVIGDRLIGALVWVFQTLGDKIQQVVNLIPGGSKFLQEFGGYMQQVGQTSRNSFGILQELLTNAILGTEKSTQALIEEAAAAGDVAQARRIALAEASNLYKELEQQAEAVKEAYKAEKDELKTKYDEEKAKLTETYEERKRLIEDAKTKEQEAHTEKIQYLDDEKSRVEGIRDAVKERYDIEIAALRERTPAEQALYELEKRQIQEKIASGKLSEEELLRARARLERMEAQEKIQALQKQRAQELKPVEKELEDIAKRKTDEQRAYKDTQAQLAAQERTLKREYEDQQAALKKTYDENLKAIEDAYKNYVNMVEESKKLIDAMQNTKGKTDEAAAAQNNYNSMLEEGAKKAERIKAALEAASKIKIPAAPPQGRFAGGPVSGGSAYTVNELGKEAFLSASGRLSMINTPAWGTWRAPSSGTIIPAHLTRQLDIPAGGVNLNKIPGGAAAGRNINHSRSRSYTAGDNIVNNVTIQSQQPVKAASDMLVSLVRNRRNRSR